MAVTLILYGVWFHEPDDFSDNLFIPWSESDEGHEIQLDQQVNVQGFTRVRRNPGVVNVYNYVFRGLDKATFDALVARAGRLQFLRDSRGVATFGMFGSHNLVRWRNPRLGNVPITFMETSKQFVSELLTT